MAFCSVPHGPPRAPGLTFGVLDEGEPGLTFGAVDEGKPWAVPSGRLLSGVGTG